MQALHDVRVLDLSRLLPGPFCTQLLADLGADVIKVEDAERGDYLRWMPPLEGDYSAMFQPVNHNKRSIVLNLKAEQAREAFLKLVERADVVVEGFRPGVMDRLGLGYSILRDANPRIVLCSITGYGQDGPYRDRAGHDIDYLALAGVLSVTGCAPGVPALPGVQMGDLGGGALSAAVAILAALYERERTGTGRHCDVAMLDGLISWMGPVRAMQGGAAEPPGPGTMPLNGLHPCYRIYACADGHLAVGALEPKFWRAFVTGIGLPELADEGFASGPDAARVVARVEAVLSTRTRAQWADALGEAQTCCEPVLTLPEVAQHPQVRARATHAGSSGSPVPRYGEHTRAILAEAGYDDSAFAGLVRAGATIESS